jgi:hypothetical protein
MKTKENLESSKPFTIEAAPQKAKPKSFRPMRSLVATRSFKPKTVVANMIVKMEETERRA